MHSHSCFPLALRAVAELAEARARPSRPPRLFGSLRSPATAGIYGELRRARPLVAWLVQEPSPAAYPL